MIDKSTTKMRYKRILKPVRFDEHLIEDSNRYMAKTGINFSDLVRISLNSFLRRKLYDVEDSWYE